MPVDPPFGPRKLKIPTARPHKGAGGVAAPTRDKLQPEAKPKDVLRYPDRGRATKVKPVPYGTPGYDPDQGLPSDAPRIKVAPDTGFDSSTMWAPKEQVAAAKQRRQNLGSVADTARQLLDQATGYTSAEKAIHSGKATKILKEAGIQAAAFVPFGRPAEVLERGALGAKAAERAVGSGVEKKAVEYAPRTLVHNDLEQQLPRARSRITQPFERGVDKLSTELQKSKHVVDTPLVRIVTSGERVAKGAGRAQRIEASRAPAAMMEHLNAIGAVKRDSPEDVANFWYAQLPSTHRNAEGLKLIRDKQAEELQYITSGKALEDLNAHETALKVKMGEAETSGEAMRHLRELEEVKLLKTDMAEARPVDVSASIAQLDKLIESPPAVNDAAIHSAGALSADRERILTESGRLDPERAGNRQWLVSDWLGITPQKEVASGFVPPPDTLFHGSPDGLLGKIDTYHHTKPWEEGIGLYVTEDFNKSAGYAKGRTAVKDRKMGATDKGAVNYVKLKPDARVLDMNAPADLSLWQRLSGFDKKDFDHYIVRQAGKNPTNQKIRDEVLYQLRDLHGNEAVYALEEAYVNEGIQATTHIEGAKSTPHRVWVIKDPAVVETNGGVSLRDFQSTQASDYSGAAPTYIGHRLPKPEGFAGSTMPSGGVGRVKSPQGLGRENKLVLAKTGRLRASMHVANEDWHSAQVFAQANVARDDLAKIGTPFTGHVPKDHYLINPKGHTVPPHWKNEELAQFAGDSYDDVESIREQAKEILEGFIATDRAGFERIKQDALDGGVSWDELRVVPKRLVDRYYAQFRSSKSRGNAAKVYDTAIDAVAASIVFARVGYIPKNLAQNFIMAVPHQGAFLLVNGVRAGQVMRDAELKALIRGEIGYTGATGALGKEAVHKKAFGWAADKVTKVADDPLRISAFLHEAAAEGVISKVRPLLNEKDRAALIDLFKNETHRTLLNDIRSRSVDAMADFSRMTPDQARMMRRFLIIPGWLMAGSRYPFHFAATHPIRSALLAYIGLGEPGAPEGLQFNQPVNHYFTGTSYREGIETPWGRLRTGSLNPVTTPLDLALAAKGSAQGKSSPFDTETPTAFDEAQPLGSAIIRIAQGEDAKKSLLRLVPNEKLVEGLIHPAESATYPEDATRLGRLKREVGIIPIDVNDPAKPPTPESKERKRLAPVRKVFGQVPPEVRAAEHTRTVYHEMQKELKKDNDTHGLSEREQVKLKLKILAESHPEYADTVDQLRQTVDENTEPDVFASVNRWTEKALGWDIADKFESEAKQVAAAHG